MTFTVWESGVVTLWSTERVRVDKALFRPPPLSLSLSRSLHHSLTPNRKSRSYPRRCQMRNAFSGEQEHPTVQRTADSILRTSFSLYLCLLTGWQTAGLIGRCTGRLINCNTPPPTLTWLYICLNSSSSSHLTSVLLYIILLLYLVKIWWRRRKVV